jgi:hypothetical protein
VSRVRLGSWYALACPTLTPSTVTCNPAEPKARKESEQAEDQSAGLWFHGRSPFSSALQKARRERISRSSRHFVVERQQASAAKAARRTPEAPRTLRRVTSVLSTVAPFEGLWEARRPRIARLPDIWLGTRRKFPRKLC